MWIGISLVLLTTLVVSTLSSPHPDDQAYKIPEVGTGQRSQYYVLHSDGTFKHGFDDGEGGFESVKSHTVGTRNGKFGYVDPDGKEIKLEYEAGKGGFVARGDHLPKPSPEHIKAFSDFVKSSKHSKTSQTHKPSKSHDEPWDSDTDASYGFDFASEDHARSEKSDADGTVTGSYSYIDENGVKRSYNYRAGKGIGFVIEGDGLSQDAHPTHSAQIHRSRTPTNVRGFSRKVQSPVSRSQFFRGQQANIVHTKSDNPRDASYSFAYDAGDHSRSENSNSNLDIDGKFSFIADDGKERTVNYVAGSSTGFQAQGAHLPKAPESHFGSHVPSGVRRTSSSRKQTSRTSSSAGGQVLLPQRGDFSGHKFGLDTDKFTKRPIQRHFEEANIRSSFSPQGPYSFSYETSSHSRSEKGDENNNVDGKFAFVADDDGKRREIKYEAGSDTGFIAEGSHIPIGPAVPGAPSGQPTGRIVPVVSIPFVDPLASSDSDASYNYGFNSETYSRSETADKDGNVVGSYTVVDDDGTRRTYNFRAGEGIGFETEEVSRTQGPPPSKPLPYTGPLAHTETTFPSRAFVPSPHLIHTAPKPLAPSLTHAQTTFPSSAFFPSSHVIHTAPKPLAPSFADLGVTYLPPSRPFQQRHQLHQQQQTQLHKQRQQHQSQDFTLNTYAASPGSDKFGYVLKFN